MRVGENARGTSGYIGIDQSPYLVVDNFLAEPQQFIDKVNHSVDFKEDASFYPGVRATAPKVYSKLLVSALHEKLVSHFQIDPRQIRSVESYFSIVTKNPSKLGLMQTIPHFDFPLKKGLASILYLFEGGKGGTSLYRHKATGYERIDPERFNSYKKALEGEFLDGSNMPQGYIFQTNDFFQKIHSFEAAFNRLVVYRGSSLHSGDIGPEYDFDPSPKTGRLTLTSFIHVNE